MGIEKLNTWMKPTKNFSCFMWMMLVSHQIAIIQNSDGQTAADQIYVCFLQKLPNKFTLHS
jgi:hypothetical protein